jgi:hypothetical protein
MPGIDGMTRTYRLNASVRIAKYSALINDATDTTEITGALFVKLPTGSNQGPVQGVTIEHWLEPGTFYQEDTDPSTITGTTPNVPYNASMGGTGLQIGPTLQIRGQARCYAAQAFNAGQIVVIADAYGRVNTPANLSISGGTTIYPVGIAVSAAAAINNVVLVDLDFFPVPYI